MMVMSDAYMEVKVDWETMLLFKLTTRLCSQSSNLRQGRNLKQKWSGIRTWINPDLDTDICQIAAKMLRILYLVGVRQSAECRKYRPLTVWETLVF